MRKWLREWLQRFFGGDAGSALPPHIPPGNEEGKIGVRIIWCVIRASGRKDYVTTTVNADPGIDPEQLVNTVQSMILGDQVKSNAWSMSDPIEEADECGFYIFEHGFDMPTLTF